MKTICELRGMGKLKKMKVWGVAGYSEGGILPEGKIQSSYPGCDASQTLVETRCEGGVCVAFLPSVIPPGSVGIYGGCKPKHGGGTEGHGGEMAASRSPPLCHALSADAPNFSHPPSKAFISLPVPPPDHNNVHTDAHISDYEKNA